MSAGEMVSLILGLFFICVGLRSRKNKAWKREKIKEWLSYPKTMARITGTIDAGSSNNYEGYYYDAELLIDGRGYRGKSYDRFYSKRSCEIGEEVEVAYKPVENSAILDSIMGVMTEAILDKNWEEEKPRYSFKILDGTKYLNEEKNSHGWMFFVGFGMLILLVFACSLLGIIE